MSDAGETVRQFVASFEKRDAELLKTFLDDAIVFSNHGDPEVRGKENVVQIWKRVFTAFAQVRFETIRQAVDGAIVLAEQIHHLALPGRESAAIPNMATYEVRNGRIVLWHDYSDGQSARETLNATKPLAAPQS
ncbi:limonene-1,2-epoxide hydrolase catalytic domain [Komagataeibacter europaeus]|uniref:SnoaL-like domain-containing protein n=3 Tax=Acetobacteraceae TaxID=433 RepID=A0A511XMK1_9PROT|nr:MULTISPECIES: limonene-1,2-epoxide hydrolase family protein [Acetobacteraceae]KON64024.1 limonene-1,2-epoxide hydrolase catalytic domain [Komagataeibacter europaeus]MBB3882031.1 limonene-1,2-epoxide hydrolase [Acetobacter oeni]NHN83853.1 nuclear transport factor 2 family protein [Acetobacter musti]NHN93056.1 nuclear transport factor 2 family protein [Acetobacter sicerae]NHO17653.1 nuclear transport factor 2 family protein [Acetobacter oeni]